MNKEIKVVRNSEFGFYQVSPLPTPEELERFYNSNFFNTGSYAPAYSDRELFHKDLPGMEIELISKKSGGRILDIGYGEGFILNYFHRRGWNVSGVDFSWDGLERHFPELKKFAAKGDLFASLDDLIRQGQTYDVIVCNNVLEHVLDPLSFLKQLRALMHKDTLVRIQCPNDFSWLQGELKKDSMIKGEYWVAPPGHLSYFNNASLEKVLAGHGIKVVDMLGDFPIELFLTNEKSNYNVDPSLGKAAHQARLYVDVGLAKSSMDKYMEFRRGCGRSGICRNLIAYGRMA